MSEAKEQKIVVSAQGIRRVVEGFNEAKAIRSMKTIDLLDILYDWQVRDQTVLDICRFELEGRSKSRYLQQAIKSSELRNRAFTNYTYWR